VKLNKVHTIITEKIIAALESGVVPWRKPWNGGTMRPRNLITKRPYSGINVMLLSLTGAAKGFTSPYWLTKNQVVAAGGAFKPGQEPYRPATFDEGGEVVTAGTGSNQNGALVTFWGTMNAKKKSPNAKKGRVVSTIDGQPVTRDDEGPRFFKYFLVWNVEQTTGLESHLPAPVTTAPVAPDVAAEAIVAGYPNGPTMDHTSGAASYRPSTDHVSLPPRNSFTGTVPYYATVFHELVHSTGHESRLKRFARGTALGKGEVYSKEELVAEVGAAFLGAEAGLPDNLEQNAAYIKSWLTVLRNDHGCVISAASQAQKATDHILGR
jgi:antirestriction protein ArdC